MLKAVDMEKCLTQALKEEWDKRKTGRPADETWILTGLKSIHRTPELHGKVLYRALELAAK